MSTENTAERGNASVTAMRQSIPSVRCVSRNAKLANIIEYGKHGQPAKPFLKPAKTASRQECIDAMTKALDEEVEKL